MKLIVDTNILVSALVKDSAARWLLIHINAELMTIGLTRDEIMEHEKELLTKADISKEEFYMILDRLLDKLIIVDDSLVKTKMQAAKSIMDKIDEGDTPFIAAALATDSAIWSDDAHFEKQSKVKVFKTRDILKFLTP